jgi:hypothetical protein
MHAPTCRKRQAQRQQRQPDSGAQKLEACVLEEPCMKKHKATGTSILAKHRRQPDAAMPNRRKQFPGWNQERSGTMGL